MCRLGMLLAIGASKVTTCSATLSSLKGRTMGEQQSIRIRKLQIERDNILFALTHHELPDPVVLQLETQLSSVEDELVFLRTDMAA